MHGLNHYVILWDPGSLTDWFSVSYLSNLSFGP